MNPRTKKTSATRTVTPTPSTPRTVEQYVRWAQRVLKVDHNDTIRRWYDTNATSALNAAQEHPFFKDLALDLEAAHVAYRKSCGVDLLMERDRQINLVTKPYASILDKSLRRNVLENANFPSAPKSGWFEPQSWFIQNNDIVRSVLACKYMDGPKFLADRLQQRASKLRLKHRSKSQQNDDGYYAYHFYAHIPVELTKLDWTSETVDVEVEVQITTQLQEVLRALTHRVYEHRRLLPDADPHSWKWESDSERFHAAYLGHALHMLEAIILDLRRRGVKS